ncbi:unnamed protein product [Brassica oleracea]
MVLLFGFFCCIRQDLVELFSPVMMIVCLRVVPLGCFLPRLIITIAASVLSLSLSLSLYLYTCIHTYIIVAVVVMLWHGGNNQCVAPSVTYKLLPST